MQRASLAILIGLAALTAPARAADWPSVYATAEADTAQDCARLCADDTLCNVWLFRARVCGFSASVPNSADAEAVSGVSPHAPGFIRLQFAPTASAPGPAPERAWPPAPETAPGPALAPAAQAGATSDPSEQSVAEAETALLGGPDEDALRPRLSVRR